MALRLRPWTVKREAALDFVAKVHRLLELPGRGRATGRANEGADQMTSEEQQAMGDMVSGHEGWADHYAHRGNPARERAHRLAAAAIRALMEPAKPAQAWLCCHCGGVYVSLEEMRAHQRSCSTKPAADVMPDLAQALSDVPSRAHGPAATRRPAREVARLILETLGKDPDHCPVALDGITTIIEADRRGQPAIEARDREAAAPKRWFRVMDPPPGCPQQVPWSLLEPCEPQALRNHEQTLQELNDRGGLGVYEMVAVLEGRSCKKMGDAAATARLRELLAAHEAELERKAGLVPVAEVARWMELNGMPLDALALRDNTWRDDLARMDAAKERP